MRGTRLNDTQTLPIAAGSGKEVSMAAASLTTARAGGEVCRELRVPPSEQEKREKRSLNQNHLMRTEL